MILSMYQPWMSRIIKLLETSGTISLRFKDIYMRVWHVYMSFGIFGSWQNLRSMWEDKMERKFEISVRVEVSMVCSYVATSGPGS